MTGADVIRDTLEYFGPNGEHWCEEGANSGAGDDLKLCLAMGLARGAKWTGGSFRINPWARAINTCRAEVGCPLADFNDDPHTTWLNIKLVLKRALARLEETGE